MPPFLLNPHLTLRPPNGSIYAVDMATAQCLHISQNIIHSPTLQKQVRYLMLYKESYCPQKDTVLISHPDSEGRPSIQITWPSPSTATPPNLLDEPDTNSAVKGDFHDPYGASLTPCPISVDVLRDEDDAVLQNRNTKVRDTRNCRACIIRSDLQSQCLQFQILKVPIHTQTNITPLSHATSTATHEPQPPIREAEFDSKPKLLMRQEILKPVSAQGMYMFSFAESMPTFSDS